MPNNSALAMDGASFPGWQPEKSINVVTSDGMTRVFVKGMPTWKNPFSEGDKRGTIIRRDLLGLLLAALAPAAWIQ